LHRWPASSSWSPFFRFVWEREEPEKKRINCKLWFIGKRNSSAFKIWKLLDKHGELVFKSVLVLVSSVVKPYQVILKKPINTQHPKRVKFNPKFNLVIIIIKPRKIPLNIQN
jgi:hypothetical protein